MNAFTPWTAPVTEAPARIHVWRADPFRTAIAPQTGWYAIGRQPAVFLRRGEPLHRCNP